MALSGARICTAGLRLFESEEDPRVYISKNGGLYSSGVTALTDFLVVTEADLAPALASAHFSEVKQARSLGVPLVTEDWLQDSVEAGRLLHVSRTEYDPDHLTATRFCMLALYSFIIVGLLVRVPDLYRLRKQSQVRGHEPPWPLSSWEHRLHALAICAISDWATVCFFVGLLLIVPYWFDLVRPTVYLSFALLLWTSAAVKMNWVRNPSRRFDDGREWVLYAHLVPESLKSWPYGLAICATWWLSPQTAWPAFKQSVGLSPEHRHYVGETCLWTAHFEEVENTEFAEKVTLLCRWLSLPFVLCSFRCYYLYKEVKRWPFAGWCLSASLMWKKVASDHVVTVFFAGLFMLSDFPYVRPTMAASWPFWSRPWPWGEANTLSFVIRWLARAWMVAAVAALLRWSKRPQRPRRMGVVRLPRTTDAIMMSLKYMVSVGTMYLSLNTVWAVLENYHDNHAFRKHLKAVRKNVVPSVFRPLQFFLSFATRLDARTRPFARVAEQAALDCLRILYKRFYMFVVPPLLMTSSAAALPPADSSLYNNEALVACSFLLFVGTTPLRPTYNSYKRIIVGICYIIYIAYLLFLYYS